MTADELKQALTEAGWRISANKLLPAGWTRVQALAFDQRETARLFGAATGGVPQGA